MKLDMSAAPEAVTNECGAQTGNIYRNQHGRLYLIVNHIERGPSGDKAVALIIERDGTIVNACCYGAEYFERLPMVGRAQLPSVMDTEWLIGDVR